MTISNDIVSTTRAGHRKEPGAERMLVPAVVRASRILDYLAQHPAPATLSELSKALQLPKSSTYTLCVTLSECHLIVKRPNGRITLGPHLVSWANAYLARLDISREFFSVWDEMQFFPDDTITLSIRDGRDVTYIACRNGQHHPDFSFRTGLRIPAIYTATGLAMLSTLRTKYINELYDTTHHPWPKPWTARGVRNLPALQRELERIRNRGYSIDDGAVRLGMFCIGAPVFDSHSKEAIAGVAVTLRTESISETQTVTASRAVLHLAKRLSARLGANHGRGTNV